MIRKRSVTIRGHRTSYSIENEFHEELVAIASRKGISLSALVAGIDARRTEGENLSSALRLHVLRQLRLVNGKG